MTVIKRQPDRAIEVYETAMKKNPKDHNLARKIGQAYVRSHNFVKVQPIFIISPIV